MLKSLPTLSNAINAIKAADSSYLPSSANKKTKGKRRKATSLSPTHSDDDEEDESDEAKMRSFQSSMAKTVNRVTKTLRDIDNINLGTSKQSESNTGRAKARSNQMEFIEDQCTRLKTSLPLEYHTRNLNHKRVYKQMVEIDERIDFTAKAWRQAMTEFSMLENTEEKKPAQKTEKQGKGKGVKEGKESKGKEGKKDQAGVEETIEYDSDEMEELLNTMNEFIKNLSVMTPEQKQVMMQKRRDEEDDDDDPVKILATSKLSVFRKKCISQIHDILSKNRKSIDEVIESHNARIKELDKEQQTVKKQVDAAESAMKERINKENMIKQVVESRFKASITQLSEHIDTQTKKYNLLLENYNLLVKQQTYVRNMYEEIKNKRHNVDPFLRRRAVNMVRGLLQSLDERALQIQKLREEEITRNYHIVLVSKKETKEMVAEYEFINEMYKELQEKVTNYEESLAKEKEIYRQKAKEVRAQAEEMEAKLAKLESGLHERARDERRQSHMYNKTIALKGDGQGEQPREVLSNEEYIQRLLDIFQQQNPGAGIRGANNRKKSRRSSKFLPTLTNNNNKGQGKKDNEDLGSDKDDRSHKRNSISQNKLQPLVDEDTEDKLLFTSNEENRRNMVHSNLQPMALIRQAQSGQSALNTTTNDEDDIIKISLTILSESETEEETDKEVEDSKVKTESNKEKPNDVDSVEQQMSIQSEMCTACYAHFYRLHALHNPNAHLRRANPKLKNAALIVKSTLEFGKNINEQDYDSASTVRNLAQLNNRYHHPSHQNHAANRMQVTRKQQMRIDENSFQFSVTESIYVLLEAVDMCKSWSILDLVHCVNFIRELNGLLRLSQKYALFLQNSKSKPSMEVMNNVMDCKLSLHKFCLHLFEVLDQKMIKVCYVNNKKSFFVEVYQSTLAILAVVLNVTLNHHIPPQVLESHILKVDWLESLNKQVVFVILGGYHLLVGQQKGKDKVKKGGVVKMSVRKFSTVLIQNSLTDSTLHENDPGHIYPYDLIGHVLNIIKTSFTSLSLPATATVAQKKQLDLYISYMQILANEVSGLLQQLEQEYEQVRTSWSFEIEHYIAFHMFEFFFYAIAMRSPLTVEKFSSLLHGIKYAGYHRHKSQSSYILDPIYLSIGLKSFDTTYSALLFMQAIPSIFLFYMYKEVIYCDIKKRLMVYQIHQDNEGNKGEVMGVAGHALGSLSSDSRGISSPKHATTGENNTYDLQFLNPTLPIKAELEMKALARNSNTKTNMSGNDGEGSKASIHNTNNKNKVNSNHHKSANTTAAPNNDSSAIDMVTNYAENYMKQRYQIGSYTPFSPPAPASADPSSHGAEREGAYLTKEEREALPQSRLEAHEKWRKEMRRYINYLSREVYLLLYHNALRQQQYPALFPSPTLSSSLQEKKRVDLENARSLDSQIPERLIYRILSHLDSLHSTLNSHSPRGEEILLAQSNAFQQNVVDLMISEQKIFQVLHAVTWPLKKKILYLRERVQQMIGERLRGETGISTTQRNNALLRQDIGDLQRSLTLLRGVAGARAGAGTGGLGLTSLSSPPLLSMHSPRIQHLIAHYLFEEKNSKIASYKSKLRHLSDLLQQKREEYEEVKYHALSLLRTHNKLYASLPPELADNELVKDIYSLPEKTEQKLKMELSTRILTMKASLAKAKGGGEGVGGVKGKGIGREGRKGKKGGGRKNRGVSRGGESVSSLPSPLSLPSLQDSFLSSSSEEEGEGEEGGSEGGPGGKGGRDRRGKGESQGRGGVASLLNQFLRKARLGEVLALYQGGHDEERPREWAGRRWRERKDAQALSPKLFAFGQRISLGLRAQEQQYQEVHERRERDQPRAFLPGPGDWREGLHLPPPTLPVPSAPDSSPLSLSGREVKIALPPQGGRRAYLSSLPSFSPFLIEEEGARLALPRSTPLHLLRLLRGLGGGEEEEGEGGAGEREEERGGKGGLFEKYRPISLPLSPSPIVYDDELEGEGEGGSAPSSLLSPSAPPPFTPSPPSPTHIPAAPLSLSSSLPSSLPSSTKAEAGGRAQGGAWEPAGVWAGGAELAGLERLSLSLQKEVRALVAKAREAFLSLRASSLPPSLLHPPRGSSPRKKKKFISPITWPVPPPDWPRLLRRQFEREDEEKRGEDSRQFSSIQLEEDFSSLHHSALLSRQRRPGEKGQGAYAHLSHLLPRSRAQSQESEQSEGEEEEEREGESSSPPLTLPGSSLPVPSLPVPSLSSPSPPLSASAGLSPAVVSSLLAARYDMGGSRGTSRAPATPPRSSRPSSSFLSPRTQRLTESRGEEGKAEAEADAEAEIR